MLMTCLRYCGHCGKKFKPKTKYQKNCDACWCWHQKASKLTPNTPLQTKRVQQKHNTKLVL